MSRYLHERLIDWQKVVLRKVHVSFGTSEHWVLICVKHIYNFCLIHASFVMLSHVSTIILHHFYTFCRTNLLTRYPLPVSCFCCFCISEKIYHRKYSRIALENYGEFLFDKMESESKGRPGGHPGARGS